jgi:hypothetical protein
MSLERLACLGLHHGQLVSDANVFGELLMFGDGKRSLARLASQAGHALVVFPTEIHAENVSGDFG